jgi:hypothetical protein
VLIHVWLDARIPSSFQMQHTLRGVPELRLAATLGVEPEVEVALV